MSETQEIEFKNILTVSEFIFLTEKLGLEEKDFFIQTNIYFDTYAKHLQKEKMGLRIRCLPDKFELTLKTPLSEGLLETTDYLTSETLNTIKQKKQIPSNGTVAEKLGQMNIHIPDLQPIGLVKTKRAQIRQLNHLIVLDKSWYNQKIDYELEIEVRELNAGKRFFDDFLNTYHIQRREAQNKIQRMLESKESGMSQNNWNWE